jgi:hypothetical protein
VRALFVPGLNSELGQAGGSSGSDKPQVRRPATN